MEVVAKVAHYVRHDDLKHEAVSEALAALAGIPEGERATLLGRVAASLDDRTLPQAREIALSLGDPLSSAYALEQLAPYLPAGQRSEALAEATKRKTSAVIGAMAVADSLGDHSTRAWALAQIAKYSDGELKTQALTEATAVARDIRDEGKKAETLIFLARDQPELMCDALDAARGQEPAALRFAIRVLGGKFSNRLKVAALQRAQNESYQGAMQILHAIAPHLSGELHCLAVAMGLQMASGQYRAGWLTALARATNLPKRLQNRTARLALAAVEAAEIDEQRYAGSTLVNLSELPLLRRELLPCLPIAVRRKMAREALVRAREVEKDEERAVALAELLPYLPQRQTRKVALEANSVARNTGDVKCRVIAIDLLKPYLSEHLVLEAATEALRIVGSITNHPEQITVLTRLAPLLPDDLCLEAVTKALALAKGCLPFHDEPCVLEEILPCLTTDELRAEALAVVRCLGNPPKRFKALRVLVPVLGPDLLRRVATEEFDQWLPSVEQGLTRKEALQVLGTFFIPALAQLGDVDALTGGGGFLATRDVGRWWP